MKTYQDNGGSLKLLRAKIDQCDNEIIELLDRRFELVREIGRYKASLNLPVSDGTREMQVLAQRAAKAPPRSRSFVENIFKLIISESCQVQKEDRNAHAPSKFSYKKIAVVGLGLIGTSICLALKKAKVDCKITGFDSNWTKAEQVLAMGAIDKLAHDLVDCVGQADLIVIAVPISAIKQVLMEIAPHVEYGTVIIDVGSSKEQVCQWMNSILPQHTFFVGGHPLAGKTDTSVESADENLFRQSLFVITPSKRTNTMALRAARQLINVIGAEECVMPASVHDQQVAWVSHLPFLISACLVSTVTKHNMWPEAQKLAATGFYDTSRLSSGAAEMHTDICITNRDNILKALASFRTVLTAVEELILREDVDGLRSFFSIAKHERDKWLSNVGKKREHDKI